MAELLLLEVNEYTRRRRRRRRRRSSTAGWRTYLELLRKVLSKRNVKVATAEETIVRRGNDPDLALGEGSWCGGGERAS